jgi:hypothetical protein
MGFKLLNVYVNTQSSKNKAAAIKLISVTNGFYKEGAVLPN